MQIVQRIVKCHLVTWTADEAADFLIRKGFEKPAFSTARGATRELHAKSDGVRIHVRIFGSRRGTLITTHAESWGIQKGSVLGTLAGAVTHLIGEIHSPENVDLRRAVNKTLGSYILPEENVDLGDYEAGFRFLDKIMPKQGVKIMTSEINTPLDMNAFSAATVECIGKIFMTPELRTRFLTLLSMKGLKTAWVSIRDFFGSLGTRG